MGVSLEWLRKTKEGKNYSTVATVEQETVTFLEQYVQKGGC